MAEGVPAREASDIAETDFAEMVQRYVKETP
jgi:hypothetical protein